MNADITEQLLKQLETVIQRGREVLGKSRRSDLSDLDEIVMHSVIVGARAAIERASKDSIYDRQVRDIWNDGNPAHDHGHKLKRIVGVAEQLYADLEAGYMASVSELMHGEVFADILEMAQHLLDEKYKDAAAVMAGGALEAHLRQLCEKHGIDTEVSTRQGGLRPKRADQMNSDLAKASVYEKLEQKNVTAWLDLRNKAAHAEYEKYVDTQVALLITGVRDFIYRFPA